MMKKGTALFLAGILGISLAGCSVPSESPRDAAVVVTAVPAAASEEENLEEITGRVSDIHGMVYTLELGTMSGAAMPQPAQEKGTPPETPGAQTAPGEPPGEGGKMPPVSGGFTFAASGRTAEVDLTGAVVRAEDGEVEINMPVSDIVTGDVITAFVTRSGRCAYVTVVATADEVWAGMAQDAQQGTAANEISEDQTVSGMVFESAGGDENALRITAADVTLNDVTVRKSGGTSSSTENGDFYGMNAALLATDGAQLTMNGCTVESNAQNGNGVFSYGTGTSVDISNSRITTSQDNSGGLQTTGGASLDAHNLTVSTAGSGSAAIRSDRGGGYVTVTGGIYATTGRNSPAVYSTADISVSGAQLTAAGSEALVIEGKNALRLEDCTVSGAMSATEGSSSHENVHNVMIYQSMSRDAQEGEGSFCMRGGSLTGARGDMFYVTNTHAQIELDGVSITNRDQLAWLFNIAGNTGSLGWGTAGANGAHADITLRNQNTIGDVRVDSLSSLDFHLADQTTLTGGVRLEPNEAADENAVGIANVTIDAGCTWRLTGDCQVTTLENSGTIDFAGHSITLADGTVLTA